MNTAETNAIQVVVNGQTRRVPRGLDVAQLLKVLEIDPSRVAVELNRSIVPKPAWTATPVEEGAEVEIVWFVGGGL